MVDVDPRHGGFETLEEFENDRPDGPLPTTLTALTGGGGRHLFFTYPTDSSVPGRNPWMPGVDVKSDGGYVILSPGTHISGGRYSWLNIEIAGMVPAPSDLLESIRDTAAGAANRESLGETRDILQGVPEGKRDETLFRFACRMRRTLGDDRELVTAAVLKAARNCNPPFEESEALRKVDQAFKQDHADDYASWQQPMAEDGQRLNHLTDMGNRNRLLELHGGDIRYVSEWGWLRWTAIGWQMTSTERILGLAEDVPDIIRYEATNRITDSNLQTKFLRHSMATESAGSIAAIERLARNASSVIRTVDQFDSNDLEISSRNGIVDLTTGEIREFTRDDMVTKNTNVVYDPDYRLPAWEDFLKESTQGDMEMVNYLQRAAGYTLTGSTGEEVFFVISGPTASGKSTFLEAMLGCMGHYGNVTQSDTFMYRKNKDAARDELATLVGMRLVSMSEIREGETFNVALINQVTGGDKVKAKFLYKNPFDFRPQFKLWLATNHDPSSQDEALLRRIKRIPFQHTIPEHRRNPALKALLKDPEVGGRAVLAWAVRGAMLWHQSGLQQPDRVTLAVHEYRTENDSFGRFIEECFIRHPDGQVGGKEAFASYMAWCPLNNEYAGRRPQFNQKMKERGFPRTADDIFMGLMPKQVYVSGSGAVGWQ